MLMLSPLMLLTIPNASPAGAVVGTAGNLQIPELRRNFFTEHDTFNPVVAILVNWNLLWGNFGKDSKPCHRQNIRIKESINEDSNNWWKLKKIPQKNSYACYAFAKPPVISIQQTLSRGKLSVILLLLLKYSVEEKEIQLMLVMYLQHYCLLNYQLF